jgi:hypothetical protein
VKTAALEPHLLDVALAATLPVEANRDARPLPVVRSLGDLKVDADTNGGSLLGNRFLCRGGGLLLAAPTGIGKSVFTIQAAILWALGRDFLGIKPAKPLQVLIVQAENDDGDIAEIRDGIVARLGLSPAEAADAFGRVKIVCESAATGAVFVELVNALLVEHPADILIVDPLFAYCGCNVSDQERMSQFLRNWVNPVLARHGVGLILVHHTNKPATGHEKSDWRAGDFAYLGSGSAELANWARAVIGLRSIGSHDIFELVLGKRGKRAGITDGDGKPVFKMFIRHCTPEICWELAPEPEALTAPGRKPATTVEDVVRLIPLTGAISHPKLLNSGRAAGIGQNKLRNLLAEAVEEGEVHIWLTPRPGTNPAKSYSRLKQDLLNK